MRLALARGTTLAVPLPFPVHQMLMFSLCMHLDHPCGWNSWRLMSDIDKQWSDKKRQKKKADLVPVLFFPLNVSKSRSVWLCSSHTLPSVCPPLSAPFSHLPRWQLPNWAENPMSSKLTFHLRGEMNRGALTVLYDIKTIRRVTRGIFLLLLCIPWGLGKWVSSGFRLCPTAGGEALLQKD